MRTRRVLGCLVLASLLASFLAAAAAASGDPSALEADDLAVLLADLEALGGILDSEDITLLEQALRESAPEPAATSSGLWTAAVDMRPGAALRGDTRVRYGTDRLRLGARWRQGDGSSTGAAWLQGGGRAWRLTGGAGSLAHGNGLLAASLGARSSLGLDASLLPATPGWRPSLATTVPQRLVGIAAYVDGGWLNLQAAAARDRERLAAHHVRLGLQCGRPRRRGDGLQLGLLGLRRGAAQAGGLDLRWTRGPWSLAAEAGAWRLQPDQAGAGAWLLAAGWRRRSWLAEFQAASARAAVAMPGAQRPACLSGWLGQGWAWRLSGRPAAAWRVAIAGTAGEDRDPQLAAGRRRARQLLTLAVAGPWSAAGTWEVRWRRLEEARRAWDPAQAWLPAQETGRRLRTWWVLQAGHPAAGGTVQVAWRRLEEAGQARNLMTVSWRRDGRRVRWRAGWQSAWGQPLDLVTVSAPVSSLLRLRHWGTWDSGLQLGVEGRGRWRWQVGGELRRRSEAAGGGLVGEGRLLWGRSF